MAMGSVPQPDPIFGWCLAPFFHKVSVEYGYRAKMDLKQFPDIWLKVDKTEIAISIITNVNSNQDHTFAKEIKKRHKYFVERGMHPVWFIENKELAIEEGKNAIVLWEAEESIALYTTEDKRWETVLKSIAKDLSFFNLYNYTPSISVLNMEERKMEHEKNESKSIMTYNDLKFFLKEKINLTQPEQQELWSKYMIPKIGVKNAQKVWDIVVDNDVKSFNELRRLLK